MNTIIKEIWQIYVLEKQQTTFPLSFCNCLTWYWTIKKLRPINGCLLDLVENKNSKKKTTEGKENLDIRILSLNWEYRDSKPVKVITVRHFGSLKIKKEKNSDWFVIQGNCKNPSYCKDLTKLMNIHFVTQNIESSSTEKPWK